MPGGDKKEDVTGDIAGRGAYAASPTHVLGGDGRRATYTTDLYLEYLR